MTDKDLKIEDKVEDEIKEEQYGFYGQVKNPFDSEKDYIKELTSKEKWEQDGREYPYLKGLKRLAHIHRGGLQEVRSTIVKVPCVDSTGTKGAAPDCIAAVTVSLTFKDGTTFEGSADASFKAHKAPFNKHLVATAESKAEARAIRRALNISQVAKEEMGQVIDDDNRDNEPINDTQLGGIKRIARRKHLSQKDVLGLIKRDDLGDIKQLTQAEAIMALKAVNRYKPKQPTEAAPASTEA